MAHKIHTRALRYRADKKGRSRKPRPKSFTNETSAKNWAEKQGIQKYTIKNLKNPEARDKKLVIVPQ